MEFGLDSRCVCLMLTGLFRETDSIIIMRQGILGMQADKALQPFRPTRWFNLFRFLQPAEEQVWRRIFRIEVRSFEEQVVGLVIEAAAVGRHAESQQQADRARIEPASFRKDIDRWLKRLR